MEKKVLKQQHQRIVCVSVRCVCVTEGGSKNKQARDAMASSNNVKISPRKSWLGRKVLLPKGYFTLWGKKSERGSKPRERPWMPAMWTGVTYRESIPRSKSGRFWFSLKWWQAIVVTTALLGTLPKHTLIANSHPDEGTSLGQTMVPLIVYL